MQGNPSKKICHDLFICLIALSVLNGCIGFPMKYGNVVFEDPYAKLGVVPVQPNAQEKAGIKLRFVTPRKGLIKSREENTLYARIKDGKGIQMKFVLNREDACLPGKQKNSFFLHSVTAMEGQKGNLLEDMELTERGEILKYIRGYHHSKIGKFQITNETRSPVFPAGPVKIGNTWGYDEQMDVKIDSLWIKEMNPTPYVMKAQCKLEGFALVKGARCAVIKTKTTQKKREHFKLKILFKELIFDIDSVIEEITYFDYTRGLVVAKITLTRSQTAGINVPMNDIGQGQAIYYIV